DQANWIIVPIKILKFVKLFDVLPEPLKSYVLVENSARFSIAGLVYHGRVDRILITPKRTAQTGKTSKATAVRTEKGSDPKNWEIVYGRRVFWLISQSSRLPELSLICSFSP